MAVNLCLGILYAWSVWKASLIATPSAPPGTPMAGLNEGWSHLSDADATWAYAICGFVCSCARPTCSDRVGSQAINHAATDRAGAAGAATFSHRL